MPPRVVNKQRVRLHRRRRRPAACHIVSSRGLEMTPRKCPTWIKKEWHGGNFDPPPSEHRVCIEERKLSRRRPPRPPAGRVIFTSGLGSRRFRRNGLKRSRGAPQKEIYWSIHFHFHPGTAAKPKQTIHPSFWSPLPPSPAPSPARSPLPKLARLIFIGGDFFLLSLPLSHTHS